MLHPSQAVSRKEGLGKYILTYFIYFLFVVWLALGFEHPGDLGYITACVVIAVASFVVVINPWNEDLFEPIKLASAFYGLSFGLGPLIVGPFGIYDIWYLGPQVPRLLRTGAYLSLLGYFCMLAAYYLCPVPRNRSRPLSPAIARKPTRGFFIGGVVVFLAGFVSYLMLVRSAGGFGHFLTYSGGRSEIFQQSFGGYYWGTLFLLSGLSVVGAAIVAKRPWAVLGLGISISIMLAFFQGRAAAIAPILVSIILIYYGHKRLSTRTLVLTAAALLFLASILGAFRAAEDKGSIRSDVAGFVIEFSTRARDNLVGTISGDIERLDMFMVCYRYVEKEGRRTRWKYIVWLGLRPCTVRYLEGWDCGQQVLFYSV